MNVLKNEIRFGKEQEHKILDKLNVNDRTEATKLASIYLPLLQD